MTRRVWLAARVGFLGTVLAIAATSTLIARGSVPSRVNASSSEATAKSALTEAEVRDRIRELTPDFPGDFGPSQVGCAVLNRNGIPVNQVVAAEIGDASYWLEYQSGGVFADQVEFITAPLFTGSPLTGQFQRFSVGGDDTDILTPFGVPLWAFDATAGPWALIVRNDLGNRALCRFEVVP